MRTLLALGSARWAVDVTLAKRIEMGDRMILGRASLRAHKVVIHPDRTFLLGLPAALGPGADGATESRPPRHGATRSTSSTRSTCI